MKLKLNSTIILGTDELFEILRRFIAENTDKQLCNTYWTETDKGTTVELILSTNVL